MSIKQDGSQGGYDNGHSGVNITCSWCGATIRSEATLRAEKMCLICHARLLNDHFQRIRKREANRATGSQSKYV